jgi:hypothetical protein
LVHQVYLLNAELSADAALALILQSEPSESPRQPSSPDFIFSRFAVKHAGGNKVAFVDSEGVSRKFMTETPAEAGRVTEYMQRFAKHLQRVAEIDIISKQQ